MRTLLAALAIGIRGTHFGALLWCQNDCGGVHVDVSNGAIVMSNGAGY